MKLNRMAQEGKKVLVIAGLIRTALIALVLLSLAFSDLYWWHITSERAVKWNFIITACVIVIAIIIDCLINPWLKKKQHGYVLENKKIIVQEGMLFVSLKHIPLFRIQNIDITEGWIMRNWQLATLTLSTAGGNSDIILINRTTAQAIMDEIKQSSQTLNEYDIETGE